MVGDKIPQRTVYDFLSAKTDTTSEIIWILMEKLGLTINPIETRKKDEIMKATKTDVVKFIDDDRGYKMWLKENESGFVVNCWREASPKYLVLHRSICGSINTDKRGNWTETDYIKICSQDKNLLKEWVRKNIGGCPESCGLCKP